MTLVQSEHVFVNDDRISQFFFIQKLLIKVHVIDQLSIDLVHHLIVFEIMFIVERHNWHLELGL